MPQKPSPKLTVEVVEWQGHVHCLYLNDTRFAGQKPWGGGQTIAKFNIDTNDLVAAVTDLPDVSRKEILQKLIECEARRTI